MALLNDPTFGDRVRPAAVTTRVREVLVRRYQRRVRPLLITASIVIIAFNAVAISTIDSISRWWPILFVEIGIFGVLLLINVVRYRSNLRLYRDGSSTAALVTSVRNLSLYSGRGADNWTLVRFRFAPAGEFDISRLLEPSPGTIERWEFLMGGWGTIAEDLESGSLLSVIYSPGDPRRCRLVAMSGGNDEDVETNVLRDPDTGEPL